MGKTFGKRGQAALEFLTTYGWAFMVILVMIGALAYFGVLNPQNLVRDQCLSTAGVDCIGASVQLAADHTGPFNITFTNNIGKPIVVGNIVLKQGTNAVVTSACKYTTDGTTDIAVANPVNQEGIVYINCHIDSGLASKKTGDKVKLAFTFDFAGIDAGEVPHLASGSVTTTIR